MTAWPLFLRPMYGESMTGALMRMAARHGSSNVQRIASWIGINWSRSTKTKDVFCIADACNLDSKDLLRFTPIRIDKKKVQIGDNHFFGGHHIRNRRRVCPDCLADDVDHADQLGIPSDYICHLRAYWEIKQIWYCHRHHRELIDSCPCCGIDLIYKYGRPRWCQNGCDLAQRRDGITVDAPFDNYLAARLGFGALKKEPTLDGIDFYDLSAFANRLGRWKLQLPAAKRGGSKTVFKEMLEHREEGYRLLANFPKSLEPIFDQTLKISRSKGKRGLFGCYDHFYNSWFGPSSDNVMQPIEKALRDHALKNLVIVKSEAVLGSETSGSGYVSISDLVKQTGINRRACSSELKRAGILQKGARLGAQCRVSEKKAIKALEKRFGLSFDFGLNKAVSRKILGISQTGLLQLTEVNLLKVNNNRITKKSLFTFICELSKLCSPGEAPCNALPVKRIAAINRVREASVYRAILRSKSNCWYDPECVQTNSQLFVIPTEKLCKAIPKRRLSRLEVARILGVRRIVVARLLEAGELQSCGGRLIWQDSVARFNEQYISACNAGRKLGLSCSELENLTKRNKIKPKFPKPKFHQNIYHRSVSDQLK